jgi:ubiquinone/menaquinone biosynthesis C-methylase UbiE
MAKKMSDLFEKNVSVWSQLGKEDPLWAILSEPGTEGGRWSIDEFFKRGEIDFARALEILKTAGVKVDGETAIDFGCGVGRVTQAICQKFSRTVGVDVAETMINEAQKLNRYKDRCTYIHNPASDLLQFDSKKFDLVYSNIVLQHIPAPESHNYIREFCRILSNDGVAIFQVPSERKFEPLTDDRFAAKITCVSKPSKFVRGRSYSLTFKVENVSAGIWPNYESSEFRTNIRLGNHWLNESRHIFLNDDGRTSLPKPLRPTESVDIELTVKIPDVSMPLWLEIDLVQEGYAWFKDKDSTTLQIPVRPSLSPAMFFEKALKRVRKVLRLQNPNAPLNAPEKPSFSMYPIHTSLVKSLIEANGCRLITTVPSDSSGQEWDDKWYVVSRS